MDNPTNSDNVLNLIPRKDLDFLDQFTDSWLIHKEMLLELNTTDMPFVEQACFQVMMMKQSRMFVDWTEFMVEHLSKWWNELRILQDADSTMFDETISILKQFIQRQSRTIQQQQQSKRKSPLHPTIGMVAFQEYKSVHKGRGHLLSTYSLAATLTSLLKVGFGRIIVVGYGPSQDTIVHVRAAFELLLSFLHHQNNNHNNTTTTTTFEKVLPPPNPSTNGTCSCWIGHTELAYVPIMKKSWVKTTAYDINIPKATIQGIQLALQGTMNYKDHGTTIETWLGNTTSSSYWKYFYLTEPDTILHTKPNLLPLLRQGMDHDGMVFLPHRLQPIPHEYNLPPEAAAAARNNKKAKTSAEGPTTSKQQQPQREKKHISKRYAGRFVPNNVLPFSNITFLDKDIDHCCDAGPEWPGRSIEQFGGTDAQMPCGTWWWACSFSDRYPIKDMTPQTILYRNRRLIPYPMMALRQYGTGIVFGPSEQGRRCFPSKEPCHTHLNKK